MGTTKRETQHMISATLQSVELQLNWVTHQAQVLCSTEIKPSL